MYLCSCYFIIKIYFYIINFILIKFIYKNRDKVSSGFFLIIPTKLKYKKRNI